MTPKQLPNDLYDESLIKIRFKGENLIQHGVPIYELGETFIAFQRIINKCYLLKENRLVSGARLDPKEREQCALQILERRRESDGYGLASLLMNPVYGGIIQGLVVLAIQGIGNYVYKRVFSSEEKSQENLLTHSIRNEVSTIVERVGNVGGVEQIEIIPGHQIEAEILSIDQDTRDYVRSIPYKEIYGDTTTIEGVITKILPRRMTIDLKTAPNKFITVQLDEQQFDRLRKSNQLHHYIRIDGRPVYQDFKTENYKKFEAQKIIITRTEAE